jgi:hypothetical protein
MSVCCHRGGFFVDKNSLVAAKRVNASATLASGVLVRIALIRLLDAKMAKVCGEVSVRCVLRLSGAGKGDHALFCRHDIVITQL